MTMRRKQILFAISMGIMGLMMLSCATKANTQGDNTDGKVSSKEELTFPVGDQLPSPPFTGQAYLKNLITKDEVYNFPTTNNITFAPGAHSSWHRHGGMILLVTGGVGYYQEEGKPAQIIRKGDVVEIPAGTRHWHGAVKDSWFSQIVIYDAAWRPEAQVDEDNTLSDEYYNNLTEEEYAGHQQSNSGFMFPVPEQTMQLPTFNGPIWLSNSYGPENVAASPAMHMVAFEAGVINAWHTHEGGQILIATDGIGYHQIEGQPVQVMHPGDVAFCPPGVKHWHGATAGTRFAHLAANTNPDKPGVEWFEILSKEDYNALPKE